MSGDRKGRVVVITGASSGIGEATAERFAEDQARLVLVARNQEKLEGVAVRCRAHGAECVIMAADVADGDALERVAVDTVKRFGRIDVWVNNAGVGSLGAFTDIPLKEHRRVIETNLIGYTNGAYAALKVFKTQKSGVLINNASVVSRLATPNLSTYVASKFGVRGLTHALRQDLALAGEKNIHVAQINPGVVDTPAFQHASNHSGRALTMRMPVTKPDTIARAIVRLSHRPRREISVGGLTSLGTFAYTVFPALTAYVLVLAAKVYMSRVPKETPETSGSLFKP